MFKHHNVASFIIALLYTVVLQQALTSGAGFFISALIFLVFCAVVLVYNRGYLVSVQKYNFWVALRIQLLFFAGLCLFLLLPTPIFRWLFLVSAFFVVSLFELTLGNFAENLQINETLIVAFGLLIGLSAASQYFPYAHQIPVKFIKWHLFDWQFSLGPLYLLLTFVVIMLLTRAFYEFVPQPDKTKWVGAVGLGLFCSELFWSLGFLPFHYSAQAIILFCFFYFCLILNYYHLFHTLSLKKIQFHLILILVAIGLVMAATPWKVLT